MGNEYKDDINQMELLFKISNDVASIMSDLRNFQANYSSDKKDTAERIEDVRKDYERDVKVLKEAFEERIKQQEAQIKQLTVYTEALRTQKDKEDAKKWRTVIAFILTGVGGLLIGSIPFIIKAVIMAGVK
jgi:leucyl-tRNA synthetase